MSNPPLTEARYFDWPVRVYYEDTDAAGVVFYANYLRFMERGRTEWLRALGFEQDVLREQEGVLFAVTAVELRYLTPARFNGLLTVRSRVIQKGGASLGFEQQIIRCTDQSLCCTGQVKVACLDAVSLRPRRLPARLLAAL
ncbi:tol-pal system-associated acyl-CoA thioesterase [Caldichromatium japonicum]|uniref:Tol-pal system-associated acyl-CoA thioesterase n=1 Tax=Caldichromatium japonicum TaxID=2699430 RepID=A0A6G7VBX3_9GAMM|nr:tol-pal system-associated acyl-CoA thioesterase [Caldichromatium japonicum]QIK37559.1 tol-pal system-associated acyl-CoA thioesterase [Caldichromatium japonicum]